MVRQLLVVIDLLHRHIDVATVQEDSEREMWAMYMAEVKEHDERITDTWKEDATGLVVFICRS
jgi:dsDNA-binding SOS-regulon protein